VVHLALQISPQIFEKIRNGPNGILCGWGQTDSWKQPEAKNLVTLSLIDQYFFKNINLYLNRYSIGIDLAIIYLKYECAQHCYLHIEVNLEKKLNSTNHRCTHKIL